MDYQKTQDKFMFLSGINLMLRGLIDKGYDLDDILEWLEETVEDYKKEIQDEASK
jgi:hypothetical protein